MIDWNKLTKEDLNLIGKICNRAEKECRKIDKMGLNMDISATHISCLLDLEKLLGFDKFNFAHDIYGITAHLDRQNGQLTACFLPRCSQG